MDFVYSRTRGCRCTEAESRTTDKQKVAQDILPEIPTVNPNEKIVIVNSFTHYLNVYLYELSSCIR